jgi:type I restriction enzyme R subunit
MEFAKRRCPCSPDFFLADRNILADQAFNAFNAFDFIDENIKVRIRPSKRKGMCP